MARKDANKCGGWKLTSEQKVAVVQAYNAGDSIRELARCFNVDRAAISGLLKRRGIVLRGIRDAMLSQNGTTLDESVFDTVTEESAYWIGFLMADGGIVPDKRHGSTAIVLVQSGCDHEHVESFRRFLKSSHKISRRPPQTSTLNGQVINSSAHSRFAFTSTRLTDALARFGVVPQKSHIAKALNGIEANRHFWRGVIDGDGSVGYYTGRYTVPHVGLCGSRLLLGQFSDFVKTIDASCIASVRPHINIYQCHTTGRFAVRIVNALYSNCHVALPRKLSIAEGMIRDYGYLLSSDATYHYNQPPTLGD